MSLIYNGNSKVSYLQFKWTCKLVWNFEKTAWIGHREEPMLDGYENKSFYMDFLMLFC